jgi:ABC-type Na+ efflux pump permease subunit
MPIWILAAKDMRVLLRDARAAVILFLMPLLMIFVLSLAVGEGLGQKPDDRLRVSVVNLDAGLPPDPGPFPGRPWSEVVLDDLSTTAGIRVELIETREQAERLVATHQRAAVLVLGPEFSREVHRCSFLSEAEPPPLNPFYRDGVSLQALGVTVLEDEQQPVTASTIQQVAQVTLLRVVMPWMIGKAFDRVGDEKFMESMARELPLFSAVPASVRKQIGPGVKKAIARMFDRYNLTAKTWAELTKKEPRPEGKGSVSRYAGEDGGGFLNRGALRYQILVPTYLVMFAFFLVLTVGWLFVAERRQGTLLRLRAAPLSRAQILLGKLLPCLAVSLFQGFFLLAAGNVVFGMSWGPAPWWLVPVTAATSIAAMGLALLVASTARTESQVAIYGTLLVLALSGLSGSLIPRDLMPEQMKEISRFTPQAWALDAYSQLLTSATPDLQLVGKACLVLCAFGAGFLLMAWRLMRLD